MIECQMMDWGYGGYGMMGYGSSLFGWIYMLLFWAAIILLIIWLYKQITGTAAKSSVAGETPLDILKKRYVRGEITKEQYEEMKRELEK